MGLEAIDWMWDERNERWIGHGWPKGRDGEERVKREERREKREEGKTEKRVIQETHLCVSGRSTPSLGI